MRTVYYYGNRRIKKSEAEAMFGVEFIRRFTDESKKDFLRDPLTNLSIWVGSDFLRVEFK